MSIKRSSSNEIYHHHDVKNKLRKTKQNKRAKQFSTTDKSQTVHKRKEKEKKKNQKRKQKKLQKAKAQNTINDKFFKKQFALLCLNKSFNGFVETETETVVCHSDFLSHTRV